MKQFPHAHHRFFSLALALVLVAWWPLCCCLISEAKAATAGGGSGEPSLQAVQVDGHGPGCHGHGDVTPAGDEHTPAPGPCECPQLVVEHLAKSPEMALPLERGRELIDLSLLSLPNRVAETTLVDPEHPPSWLHRDVDWPRAQSAPSLFALRASLTL